MKNSEAYTLVTTTSQHQNFDDYVDANSGKGYDLNVYLQAALRRQYPELALTVTVVNNGMLLLPLPLSPSHQRDVPANPSCFRS